MTASVLYYQPRAINQTEERMTEPATGTTRTNRIIKEQVGCFRTMSSTFWRAVSVGAGWTLPEKDAAARLARSRVRAGDKRGEIAVVVAQALDEVAHPIRRWQRESSILETAPADYLHGVN